MTNGAAHGSGVYFSPRLSISLQYARSPTKTWPLSRVLQAKDCCVAICEIVNRSRFISSHSLYLSSCYSGPQR
jgi:hypothetical protein